jgi:hypothetical protein
MHFGTLLSVQLRCSNLAKLVNPVKKFHRLPQE